MLGAPPPQNPRQAELLIVLIFLWRNLRRNPQKSQESGSEKGVFWKRGLFKKAHFLEILETLENLEILERPQTVENE